MEQLRFGILGCGNIAEYFMAAVRQCPEATVAACAARSPERAEAFARRHGIPKAYGSYQELIEDPAVQAVYIATVHSTHAACAKAAVLAGKAVLCEKPFFTNTREAEEGIALAKARGILMMEAFWTRTMPAYHKVKGWIRQGRIGKTALIQASFGFCVPFSEAMRHQRLWDPETAGGAILDAGVYPYQYITGIMESYPDDFEYALEYGPTGVETKAAMILRFRSGVMVECLASMVAVAHDDAIISGSDGFIIQKHFIGSRRCELYDRTHRLVEAYDDPVEDPYVHEIHHFADLFRTGKIESDWIPLADNLDFMHRADRMRGITSKEQEGNTQ